MRIIPEHELAPDDNPCSDCNTHVEFDGIRGKRDSTIEAHLTPDLHYLSN